MKSMKEYAQNDQQKEAVDNLQSSVRFLMWYHDF